MFGRAGALGAPLLGVDLSLDENPNEAIERLVRFDSLIRNPLNISARAGDNRTKRLAKTLILV
jgi:hypothetical protein